MLILSKVRYRQTYRYPRFTDCRYPRVMEFKFICWIQSSEDYLQGRWSYQREGIFCWPEKLLGEKIGPQPECVWAMISINVVCQLGVLVPILSPLRIHHFLGRMKISRLFLFKPRRFLIFVSEKLATKNLQRQETNFSPSEMMGLNGAPEAKLIHPF